MKRSTSKINIVFGSTTILCLLLGWLMLSILKDNFIFPKLSTIVTEMVRIITTLSSLKSLLFSLLRIILSVATSFAVAIGMMLLYVWKKSSLAFFKPILYFMQSAPVAAISIFIFILIGDKLGPFVICTLVIFPVMVSGMKGAVDQIDPHILDELAILDVSFVRSFFEIYIPMMFQTMMTGLIQTFGLGFKVMVMGEYICQTNFSIGKQLYIAKANLEMASLLGWTILIVIIVGILEFIFQKWNAKHAV